MSEDPSMSATDLHVKFAVLEGAVGQIITQNKGIANDMQQLRELMERIVRMEERTQESAQALGRAFNAIEAADARIDALQEKHEQKIDALQEKHEKRIDALDREHDARLVSLQRKHDRALGWIGGAMFVGSALVVVLSWNFSKQFEPLLTLPQQFNSLQAEQAAIRRTFDGYVRAEAAEKANRGRGEQHIN